MSERSVPSHRAGAAASLLIAALIVDPPQADGLGSVFYYTAALIAASTVFLFLTPLRRVVPDTARTKVAAG